MDIKHLAQGPTQSKHSINDGPFTSSGKTSLTVCASLHPQAGQDLSAVSLAYPHLSLPHLLVLKLWFYFTKLSPKGQSHSQLYPQGLAHQAQHIVGAQFFYFLLIFTGVWLLYNVVLASTAQQNASAIHAQISPPFWISLPFRSPQCIRQSSLCCTVCSHQLSILYIVSIMYMCQPQSPNSSLPTPFPLGIHAFVLYIYVSISAFQIRSYIPFFQISHICVIIRYLLFSF